MARDSLLRGPATGQISNANPVRAFTKLSGLRRYRTRCPLRWLVTKPAFSRTERCLDIDGAVISNLSARSEVVSSAFERYARIWRRELDARASKILSAFIL